MLLYKLIRYVLILICCVFAPLLILLDNIGWNLVMSVEYGPKSFKESINEYKDRIFEMYNNINKD